LRDAGADARGVHCRLSLRESTFFRGAKTTTYANGNAGTVVGLGKIMGTTETEYRLTVPTSGNTTTTTDSITLPGNAGHERVVDVSATQGNTTTANITTTLPDGTITTQVRLARPPAPPGPLLIR
jgi:hypothetical protein